ncbi:MAG TPA: MFS transporter [bacterium]|nr:MFS transporter [bacterium]
MARSASSADTHLGRTQLVRAIVASTIGTTIEWYDFFLYGTAAALVFPKVFFPQSDPYVGTLAAFGTYFVGFIGRPIGGAIFGHYGDRIGRKTTLIVTLLLMGIATFCIGLVPGYASIGVWGAVLLTILRMCQGLGVGGEWGGSVLLSMEWGHKGKRGFIASWPQFGVPAGLLLANGIVALFSSSPAFLTWLWRIPFLLSIVLVAIGLFIRLRILETPLFARLLEERRVESRPVREVIRRNPREIVLSALLRLAEQSPFYLFTTFVFTYGTGTLKLDRGMLVTAVTMAALLSLVSVPFFGYLSDVIGRKRMYLLGAVAMLVWAYPYFGLLDTRVPVLVFVAIILSLIPHDMQYGPQAALIAESFPTRLRYSGSSLGYQLASLIAGGPAPLIAVYLLHTYGTAAAISNYIIVTAILTIIATALLPDRSREDISMEHDVAAAPRVRPAT